MKLVKPLESMSRRILDDDFIVADLAAASAVPIVFAWFFCVTYLPLQVQ